MSISISTFEKACLDAYAAGYDAGFAARDRIDIKFGRRRRKEYALAVKVVADAIRKVRQSTEPNN